MSAVFRVCVSVDPILSNELTFELPDNAKECFHEKLKIGSKFVLEFQVVTGGNYDVDLVLRSPSGKVLYQDTKKQYDNIEQTAGEDGVYEFCFSNEFSTFTHKVIYIDWQVDGDLEHEIVGPNPRVAEGALTMIESKVQNIHEGLKSVIDYQTHHRLREATGRARAEDLKERVQIWSIGQFILIIIVGGFNALMDGSLIDSHHRVSLSILPNISPDINSDHGSRLSSANTSAEGCVDNNQNGVKFKNNNDNSASNNEMAKSSQFFTWRRGSISGSIAGIILGKISDITKKVKLLILITNVFEIVGNILYFLTNKISIVLLGRLIAGVGMGAVPPILADIAHRTTEVDRTKAISIILGCRQLGLLVGPCFTLVIRSMNFNIGSVNVNRYNGPGFLMAVVWFFLQIICWSCFYDRQPETTSGPSSNGLKNNDLPKHKYYRSGEEDQKQIQTEELQQQQQKQKRQSLSCKIYCQQYFRAEMLVLFLATFITYFNQTALETIVAAFTEKQFHWNQVHISILFAFAGLEIIVVYLCLVKIFSKRFEDRMLLIFGFISLTFACALGAFFTWTINKSGHSNSLLAMFIIFVFFDLLGLPFIAATSVSLFTKLTIKELQGFSQGVQRLVMGVGTIIGPLFASVLLNRLHIMMTILLCMTVLTLIFIFLVLRRLIPMTNNVEKHINNSNNLVEENGQQIAFPLSNNNNNCYVTLSRDDNGHDEENCKLLNNSSTLLSTSISDSIEREKKSNEINEECRTRSPTISHSNVGSSKFDTSSTNYICQLSDELVNSNGSDSVERS
ncbi:unnamed protein product [Didymodactylos carnosus]|uniref:Uncharacterized protein n=1 Tax=Didymodactylos carnosus TaxID=1234261 RepID=A0A814SEA9_9BILA|nr:unnamed protein product [Didymodactylos carnosus]CAF1146245.1 unnamed protein product [Didymodactylos carnosus]CAF3703958.1 unnamed protein product [Didymodactylos carnosus]CAF3909837.1 unnamed protein product [Didymodactylos carnosus]